MTSTVVEIRDGFIKDEFAKQCEPYQRPYEFLYTGRLPEVGQRTETQITSLNGNWCRLSGIVTEVGELPTFDMWVTTSSFVPPLHVCGCSSDPYAMVRPNIKMVFNENCEHPDCIMCLLRKGDTEMTLETLMERNLEVLGALQNQEVTVYAYLNFDYFGRQDQLPFSDGRIYKVVHKADDNKNCVWCVTSIEDVTDLPPSDLPQAFRDWDLGRDAAGVAPYNLSDIDRKVWKLKKEVEWIRQVEEQDEENKRLLDSNGEDDDDGVAYFDYGPKPPMSAIVLYIKDIHPTLTAEHSDAALDEILRSCLTKFEALPTEQRKVWDAREASDKARYDQEKEAHGGDY